MVVWVFAGGGESEVGLRKQDGAGDGETGGLIIFLTNTFPGCTFKRKTPLRRKPGPKPNKSMSYGRTGKSLIEQIQEELPIALKAERNQCDLIFVFDDLDCRNPETQRQKILESLSTISNFDGIPILIGFAAPELEAWIIADWDNSIAKHPNFKGKRHKRMRWWLSTQANISFDHPESFSKYDPKKDCCQDKLSEKLIESSMTEDTTNLDREPFKKGYHTSLLLTMIDANKVQRKCPLFREMYNYLQKFCCENN